MLDALVEGLPVTPVAHASVRTPCLSCVGPIEKQPCFSLLNVTIGDHINGGLVEVRLKACVSSLISRRALLRYSVLLAMQYLVRRSMESAHFVSAQLKHRICRSEERQLRAFSWGDSKSPRHVRSSLSDPQAYNTKWWICDRLTDHRIRKHHQNNFPVFFAGFPSPIGYLSAEGRFAGRRARLRLLDPASWPASECPPRDDLYAGVHWLSAGQKCEEISPRTPASPRRERGPPLCVTRIPFDRRQLDWECSALPRGRHSSGPAR